MKPAGEGSTILVSGLGRVKLFGNQPSKKCWRLLENRSMNSNQSIDISIIDQNPIDDVTRKAYSRNCRARRDCLAQQLN